MLAEGDYVKVIDDPDLYPFASGKIVSVTRSLTMGLLFNVQWIGCGVVIHYTCDQLLSITEDEFAMHALAGC